MTNSDLERLLELYADTWAGMKEVKEAVALLKEENESVDDKRIQLNKALCLAQDEISKLKEDKDCSCTKDDFIADNCPTHGEDEKEVADFKSKQIKEALKLRELVEDRIPFLQKNIDMNYDKIMIEILDNEMRNLQTLLKQSQTTDKEEGEA